MEVDPGEKAAPASVSSHPPFPLPISRQLTWLAAGFLVTLLAALALSPWDVALSLRFVEAREGAFGSFVQHWGRTPGKALAIGAAVVFALKQVRTSHPLAVRASAAILVQFVLHPGILTNLLKLLTGRPRPVHLGAAGEGFVAFPSLNPAIGDFSFPSGHVAVAMVLAPCVLLLWRERRRWASLAVGLFALGWAGTVALGRVVSGAHFPTDVVFSLGAGIALAPLSLGLGDALARRLTKGDRA